jgi:hypothetical protein
MATLPWYRSQPTPAPEDEGAGPDVEQSTVAPDVPLEWQRADCCVAQPAYRVLLPPSATRDGPAELLLCGHHFHISRRSLARAAATVYDVHGNRVRISVPTATG